MWIEVDKKRDYLISQLVYRLRGAKIRATNNNFERDNEREKDNRKMEIVLCFNKTEAYQNIDFECQIRSLWS